MKFTKLKLRNQNNPRTVRVSNPRKAQNTYTGRDLDVLKNSQRKPVYHKEVCRNFFRRKLVKVAHK